MAFLTRRKFPAGLMSTQEVGRIEDSPESVNGKKAGAWKDFTQDSFGNDNVNRRRLLGQREQTDYSPTAGRILARSDSFA